MSSISPVVSQTASVAQAFAQRSAENRKAGAATQQASVAVQRAASEEATESASAKAAESRSGGGRLDVTG